MFFPELAASPTEMTFPLQYSRQPIPYLKSFPSQQHFTKHFAFRNHPFTPPPSCLAFKESPAEVCLICMPLSHRHCCRLSIFSAMPGSVVRAAPLSAPCDKTSQHVCWWKRKAAKKSCSCRCPPCPSPGQQKGTGFPTWHNTGNCNQQPLPSIHLTTNSMLHLWDRSEPRSGTGRAAARWTSRNNLSHPETLL